MTVFVYTHTLINNSEQQIIMSTMEGSLSKWTNVVNGWQYRWFVLDDNAGLLSYYTVRISKYCNLYLTFICSLIGYTLLFLIICILHKFPLCLIFM